MKKVIFALAAVVALAACSQEDVIVADKGAAIGFDTFVENSTRSVNDPSYTNANMFADFAVFGYVEGAVLFDGVQVAKTITNNDLESAWKYAGTQYWITGAMYNFNAVAPKTDGNWTVVKKDAADNVVTNASQTTLSFTNDGETDLLYAYATAQGKNEKNDVVEFNFRHVLSKVKFSFENAYNATNATIRVENVKINDAYALGVATLNANTAWAPASNNLVLDFGNATDAADTDAKEAVDVAFAYGKTYESHNELLMIPGQGATAYTVKDANGIDVNKTGYTVTFTVELLVSEQEVAQYTHTIYTDFAPVAGHSYDLKATIDHENIDPAHSQEAIQFTVTNIGNWGTDDNGEAAGDNNKVI